MLSDEEFVLWCKRLSLSREAQSAIATIRSAGPARRVGGGRENVSGRYPSRKMGVTIQQQPFKIPIVPLLRFTIDSTLMRGKNWRSSTTLFGAVSGS